MTGVIFFRDLDYEHVDDASVHHPWAPTLPPGSSSSTSSATRSIVSQGPIAQALRWPQGRAFDWTVGFRHRAWHEQVLRLCRFSWRGPGDHSHQPPRRISDQATERCCDQRPASAGHHHQVQRRTRPSRSVAAGTAKRVCAADADGNVVRPAVAERQSVEDGFPAFPAKNSRIYIAARPAETPSATPPMPKPRTVTTQGDTVEEAIDAACHQLRVSRSDVTYDVIDHGERGRFLRRGRPARVRVTTP